MFVDLTKPRVSRVDPIFVRCASSFKVKASHLCLSESDILDGVFDSNWMVGSSDNPPILDNFSNSGIYDPVMIHKLLSIPN